MKELTLSADEYVIEQAEKIAREHGTSISAMFERYIRALTRQREMEDLYDARIIDEAMAEINTEVPPDSIAARVTGLAKLPRAGRIAICWTRR